MGKLLNQKTNLSQKLINQGIKEVLLTHIARKMYLLN